jgi:hypothetical protein
MMMRFFAAILLLLATLTTATAGDSIALDPKAIQPSGLTKDQAKQVLIVVLKHLKFKLKTPGMYVDGDIGKPGTQIRPGYYDFSLSFDTPKAAATAYLGYYSVDIMTGDVWESEQCEHYCFPALRKLQAQIMKRTGATMPSEEVSRETVGCY